jgi:hypothetical protein
MWVTLEERRLARGSRLQPEKSPDRLSRQCSEIAALDIAHIVAIVAGPWTDNAVATVVRRS